jgi:hypothetical protein
MGLRLRLALKVRTGTECVYNAKQKPGLKPGAVEALTRRVGTQPKSFEQIPRLMFDSIPRANIAG